MTQINALFLGTFEDKEYVPRLKSFFGGTATYVITEPVPMLSQLVMYCEKRSITKVVSTNTGILQKLLELSGSTKTNPSLNDYAGSLFDYRGISIVFVAPLKQLLTVSYGAFICKRFVSKVVSPEKWTEATTFAWSLLEAKNIEEAWAYLSTSYAIAADIETFKDPLSIRCIGYTGVKVSSTGEITTRSFVLPLDSSWALAWMRKINALPIQKIFQNGKYDNSYLLRYDAPCANWLWDTAHLFHSFYSELPKDLAWLNAFFLRKVVYWKDLAETHDLYEYYRYNAMDSWATANVWIRQLAELPDWAKRNYTLEFPLVFPCLLAEMTGIKRDIDRLADARAAVDLEEAEKLRSLRVMIGAPAFNPGSPPQVKQLLKLLGCGDLPSTGVNDVFKAKLRHPLNARILSLVSNKKDEDGSSIRGLRKLKTNYLRIESDAVQSGIHAGEKGAKEFQGRILCSFNPHGTDSGRLASRAHHFWCGLQLQNIPVTGPVKTTLCADEGFYIGECDLEKAESWDTGYISGDANLIAAVNSSKDFHANNASKFFGIPYEDIYDDLIKKAKNKKLRDLSKRTNHGANYNMGALVMVETMGVDKIWEANRLLKLGYTDPIKVAEHLLKVFHQTYPDIKGKYYVSVINEIGLTSKLTSRAYHHTRFNIDTYESARYIEDGDWTRFCFGRPDKNKLDLNSYVAHCPQSLNARTLNEAWMRIFYEVALPNPRDFRLFAQIHDSILFAYRKGFDHLPLAVKSCMEIPVSVKDVSGITRTFTVPASLKLGRKDRPSTYWSDTE